MIQVTDPYHPYYKKVLARAASLGYTVPSFKVQMAQSGLVYQFFKNGILGSSGLDLFYNHYHDGGQQFGFINWADPTGTLMIKTGTVNFTSLDGCKGDGSTGYLNTQIAPSSLSKYTLLDASHFCDIKDNPMPGGVQPIYGVLTGASGGSYAQLIFNGTTVACRVNNNLTNANVLLPTVADTSGLWHCQRRANNDLRLFREGTSVATSTAVSSASYKPTLSIFQCGTNANGSVSYSSTTQRCLGYGTSLSGKESTLSIIWSQYKTNCI